MPLITGIAALALMPAGNEFASIDPQVDRQFAYVKTVPTVSMEGGEDMQQPPSPPSTSALLSELPVAVQGRVESTTPARAYGYAVAPSFNNLGSLKGMDRKVSVSLNNVTAADAFKWLNKQNVNYVANLDSLPKSKISLNMKDVPLSEVLSSLAEVLSGNWQVKGSTLIFKGGFGFSLTTPGSMSFKSVPGTLFQSMPHMREAPAKAFNFQGKALSPKEMEKLHSELGKVYELKFDHDAFEKMHMDFEGKALSPKEMEKLRTELGKVYELKFDKGALEKMHKDFEGFNKDGKVWIWGDEKMSKEDKAKMEKEVADAMKAHKGALLKLGEIKGDQLKALKEDALAKSQAFGFKKVDSAKLLKSISPSQKELIKKQGFLKISDLTKEQKEMIFTDPKAEIKGDFTFVLNLDGEKLTIKN